MSKFTVGNKAYQCRNSSYVFESIKEIEEAIDEVEIVTILRVYQGKTKYLVKVLEGLDSIGMEHEQDESQLYRTKQKLVNVLVESNISFIKQLMKSDKDDLESSRKALKQRIEKSRDWQTNHKILLKAMVKGK